MNAVPYLLYKKSVLNVSTQLVAIFAPVYQDIISIPLELDALVCIEWAPGNLN